MNSKSIIAVCALFFSSTLGVVAQENEDVKVSTMTQPGQTIKASDSHIQYIGRVSKKNPDSPMFTFPGTRIRAAFMGTSLKMIAKPKSGYFMVRVDGSKAFKVCFNAKNDSVVTLAVALPDTKHDVDIMYVTEGYNRRAEFRGFILDEGKSLAEAPVMPKRRIEFIGNSITCGYGVEDVVCSDPYQDETCNHYYTYANRTAQALGAMHWVVARSGIGVYRNYNGPQTGDSVNMNTEYTHTLLYDNTETWDFSGLVPQLVCINLGTNDTSTSGADPKLLREGYRNLVKQVRSHYPEAKIVLLCGSMMSGDQLLSAQSAMNDVVKELSKKDKQLYRFDFTPQNGSLGYGASWHPSMEQHKKMAEELVPYLRSLMNWE